MKKEKKIKKLPRAPIVVVLGHIDHGKTTLLDKIRKTNLVAREAGGITQHIGAYQVSFTPKPTKKTPKPISQPITFIDTPGHEAFQEMRSRGAKVADLVVLVVAADDGVMPQTKEALRHIKEAGVPFLVAINKTDLTTAQPEKVKKQLAQEGVGLEEEGGDVVAVLVSGKTGEGIDDLLEVISLLSQLHEVSSSPGTPLQAVVIETKKDKRGPVVGVLVREGTLRVGDEVQAENIQAKIRGLFDENARVKKEVLPGEPAEAIGFKILPPVGAVVGERKEELMVEKERVRKEVGEGQPTILKADTQGGLEAAQGFLQDLVAVVGSGVGDVVESDVLLASSTGALIAGFNVKTPAKVRKLAEEEGVQIKTSGVIYELKKEVEEFISGKEKELTAKVLGRAEIIAQFPYGEKKVAGMRVVEGRISKGDRLKLLRGDEVVRDKLRIASMKRQAEAISKAEKGEELGLVFAGSVDFEIGDVVVSEQPARQNG